MKTLNKLCKFSLVVMLAIFTVSNMKSQSCNMTFVNTMGCSSSIIVEWYTSCPGLPCDSQTILVPASSSTTTATCNGCGTICDVKVTLTLIGSSTPVPTTNNYVDSSSNQDGGTMTPSCDPPGTYQMQINGGTWNISY